MPEFVGIEENHENYISVVCVPAEIRTGYILNAKSEEVTV
jgi:hypothetical protein